MQADEELIEQVRETMATTFDVDEGTIPDDVSQAQFPPWTSLAHMTLLVALEEQFGLRLSMEEMGTMTSLPKIVAVLRHHGVTS